MLEDYIAFFDSAKSLQRDNNFEALLEKYQSIELIAFTEKKAEEIYSCSFVKVNVSK